MRAAVLTALAKLAARSGNGGGGDSQTTLSRVVGVEGSFQRSADVEVQTRACEYGALLSTSSPSSASESLASAVLERLPPLDEAAHDAALDVEPVTEEEAAAALAASVGGGGAAATTTTADSLLGDLMSLEVPVVASVAAPGGGAAAAGAAAASSQPAAAAGTDALADIFGSVDLLSTTTPATPAAATPAAEAAPTAAAPSVPSPPSKATPLPEDLFAAPPAQEAPAATEAAATTPSGARSAAPAVLHSTTALSDAASGLVLSLDFSKPDAATSPEDTVVLATATRKGAGSESGAITNFSLQAAVPKYARLRLDPATGATLEAGGEITQRLRLTNTAHGAKPLALRLRVAWTPPPGAAEPRLEMVEVKDLPATL